MASVAMGTPMELTGLGPMPADEQMGCILTGLRELFDRQELCDTILIAGKQQFHAHRAVLAAASTSFRDCLMNIESKPGASNIAGSPGFKPITLDLSEDISHPQAVSALLDCVYGREAAYAADSEDANRDVLRLAQRFNIPQLQDHAAHWLASGLTTTNILRRVVIAEEFGLAEVRKKMLEQLIANPDALFTMVQDPEISKAPIVLQDLLIRVLTLLGCKGSPAAKGA